MVLCASIKVLVIMNLNRDLEHLQLDLCCLLLGNSCLFLIIYGVTLCQRGICCVRVCLSVRPSHAGIVPKQLKIGQCKQHHTIANDLE